MYATERAYPAQQPPKVTAVVVIREQLGGTGRMGIRGVIERGQRARTSEDWLPISSRMQIHLRRSHPPQRTEADPQDFLTARELGVLLLRSLAMSNVHQKETLLVADLQMIHICVI